jgi:hypothetical protein
MKAKLLALATLIAAPAFADSLSLDLNNDAVRGNYGHEFSKNYTADFAWTHVKDLGNTFTGGINLKQKINNDLQAVIGGKAVFQQHDQLEDGTAIAVGGGLRFTPPANTKVGIAASLYFAPNVLSFGDMKNYQELELRGEYAFSEQLTGYAGYRNNQADYDVAKNVDLYDGFMVGGEFHF